MQFIVISNNFQKIIAPLIFQGTRDQSVTFGFREGASTLDVRRSTDFGDFEDCHHPDDQRGHRQRNIYVRRLNESSGGGGRIGKQTLLYNLC